MCRFAAERMSYATAEARCAAAPAGGGEVCHIINPINGIRLLRDPCAASSAMVAAVQLVLWSH